MIENLTSEQIAGILESLPLDITFVDDNDTIRYWNKHDTRMSKRPSAVLGRSVQECHSSHSVEKVNKVITDLKSGREDCIEYQIELNGRKIAIKNVAVRDRNGKYLGVMEIDQDITDIVPTKGN